MGRRRRATAIVCGALALSVVVMVPTAARAAPSALVDQAAPAPVPGTGAPRPRLLYDPGTEATLRDRLGREPYRTIFLRTHQQAASWQGATLGDHTVNAQRELTRVASIRAFQYALDRTVVGDQIVPFPNAAARKAAGDQVRDILLQILDRSRLAVPAPIGGWDRDISTSEEIINAATAYDTLLGAGYVFDDDDHDEVVRRLAAVTRELRLNFVEPATANGYANFHQNNHRTKTGAALAVAAVALADEVADVRAWFDTGADYVDDTLRHTLATGDGAYSEGPFYYRYTTQNVAPYLAVWERFLGDGSWTTAGGLVIPDLGAHPMYARSQRWMLDTSVPDGTMAPIDDGNPGRSHFYGALPTDLPTTAEGYWQWARTPQPYDVDGNITLGPLSIVTYDDTITPAAPTREPTQFYVEGGTATLRSGWGADDAMALVLGEHDAASEFGRDRTGTGRWPQSHEHAEPGAFLFHAYGERLALDPGYLTFTTHGLVNKPQDHNTVLVDGQGPADYLQASLAWGTDPAARPPAEGQSTLSATVRSGAGDAVSVASAYRGATLDRRALFGDGRYLVLADEITAPVGTDLTWMLHGNGGGTSGGTYQATPTGGRWSIGGARLDSGIAATTGPTSFATSDTVHEVPYTQSRTHTALAATATSTTATTGAVQLLYPTRSGDAAPTITRSTDGGHAVVDLLDTPGDRHVSVIRRGPEGGDIAVDQVRTDGDLLVVERDAAGALRAVWAEGATRVGDTGSDLRIDSATPGTLGVRLAADGADLVADTGSPTVTVGGLGFAVADVDSACGVSPAGADRATVQLNRTRTARLLPTSGPSAPAADAGSDVRPAVGTTITLGAAASCDADGGGGLVPRWELVSAPAGSAWSLSGASTASPQLLVDRPGPYRVRLVVTDPTGRESVEDEVELRAGAQCADGVDDDLDGLIDTDDPDCDGPAWPAAEAVTPAEAYVTLLYRDLLGRTPDAAGLVYWTGVYDTVGSRSQVLSRFRRTPEVTGLVVRRGYSTYLGRAATTAEVAYWSGYLARGRSFQELEIQILASPESRAASPTVRAHVDRVLRLLIGRAPTTAELDTHTAAYGAQGSGAALRALLRGPTVTERRVGSIYQAFLGRAPEPGGQQYWAARLQAGDDAVSLVLALAATPEYAARTPRPTGPALLGPALFPGA